MRLRGNSASRMSRILTLIFRIVVTPLVQQMNERCRFALLSFDLCFCFKSRINYWGSHLYFTYLCLEGRLLSIPLSATQSPLSRR